jgi:hypothetical protein
MKHIKGDGSSGVTDMGTMLAQQGAQAAKDVASRIQREFPPGTQLSIKTVNVRNGLIEIEELRATYADGTVQRVASMVIDGA